MSAKKNKTIRNVKIEREKGLFEYRTGTSAKQPFASELSNYFMLVKCDKCTTNIELTKFTDLMMAYFPENCSVSAGGKW